MRHIRLTLSGVFSPGRRVLRVTMFSYEPTAMLSDALFCACRVSGDLRRCVLFIGQNYNPFGSEPTSGGANYLEANVEQCLPCAVC